MRGWGFRSPGAAVSLVVPPWLRRVIALVSVPLQAERDRWLLWAPAALGLGVAIYYELSFEPPVWIGLIGGAAALVLVARRALRLAGVGLLLVAVGLSLATWRTSTMAAPVLARAYGPAPIEGRIVEISRLAEGRRLVLDRVQLRDVAERDTPARIRINVTRPGSEALRVGNRIRIMAILNPPPGPAAPGAFDFQRMAWYQRLGAVGFAVQSAVVLQQGEAGGLMMQIDALRERLTSRIVEVLPGTIGGMAAALLTGEQTAIDKDTMQAMRDSGLAHLLSISGLHIAFVSAIVMGLIRYGLALIPWIALRWPVKKIAAVAALAAAFFYMLLAGAPVPAQRSFLMAGFVLVAILLDRTALTMRLVAWAAIVVLLFEPESLLSASFQMSFAAVVALCAAWESSRNLRAELRFRFTGLEQNVVARAGLYLAGVLFTTLIAGTATAAFSAFHFNRVSLLGTVANLIAVPITGIWVMPFGVLAMLLMPLGLEAVALVPMSWGIDATIWVARTVAGWPGASTGLPSMPGASLWLMTIGGLWLCFWQRRWRWLGVLPILVAFLLAFTVPRPDLLISENGRLVGLRGADERLMLSTGRAERFTAETWLRRTGLTEGEAWPRNGISADGSLRCEPGVCTYRRGLWRISIVRSEAAVQAECLRGDVLISLVPVPRRCPDPRLLLERTDFLRDGAYSLRFLPSGIEIDTVNAHRGRRPWVPRRGLAQEFER